ncbi:SWI SNF, matrix associated, actin dependent regulator of chromatin, sub c, member 2, partial [Physocladia obscura]
MSRSGSHNPGYTYSPQPIPNFLPESTRMMINSGPGMIRQTSNKRQLQNQSWHFPAKVHGSPQISRYQQSQQQSSDQYYNQNTENSGHLDSHVKLMSSRVGTSVLKRSSISGDRVKRSTRPTKMQDDYDNIGNDNDEIDFESGSDSADFINQKRMQRSVSTPPRSFYTKTTATVGTVAAALRNQAGSKDRKHRSRTADEVYEMTVNAYQADLAEEIGEERRRNASTSRNNSDNNNQNVNYGNTSARNRAVIPEPRLSSSSMSLARSGFQTRVGSLVRFSGEDEIAYEIMHTQSDASSGGTGSRGNSLQRQNNKYDKDENVIEEEDENLTILEPVKDQESPPAEVPTFALQNFESRSKSVDTRVRSAAVTQHDILKARRKEIEKELAIPPLILAARSVSVDTRTTSAAARLLQSPLSSPVVQKKKFKNESLYSIPSFNSAVHKKDASVQGKKAKKPALNSNSLNSDSKAYLLPTLFGSKNLPTVREANNSEENDSNSSDQSHQAVVTSPAIRNTTIVGAVLVSSPPPAAVPNQEYHQFLRKVSQYLPHSPQPPQPPPSSLSSPLQARYDDIKPQYSVDETIVDTSWLEYAANLSVSEHVECLSTDTLALLQEMRSAKNEAAAELVGATAFGLGYYDDFGRPTKQGTADVMTAFLGKSSAVSVVEQQFKGDDGLVQKKNEETTLVSDDDGNGDEMDDSDLSASVARLKKSRLHQISAAIGTEKSPTNSNSTSSPSSNPALKKVFNNMMAPAAKPSLSSSALPFLVSPVVSVTIDGGGGESPISPSFSSFAFPPPRSMSRTYSKQPARDVNSNNNSIQLLQSRSNDVGNSDYFPAMAVSPSLKNTSTRMCLTMASLRESLIESLQSSPGYVNATIANEQQQQKVDSEKVQNTKMEIVETLQKVNPVVKGTVVMSTIDVIAPVADEGGDGGFGRAVTEFESFQQRSGEKRKKFFYGGGEKEMTAPTEASTAPAPTENTDGGAQFNETVSADTTVNINGVSSSSSGLSALDLLAQHAHELSTLESSAVNNTKLAAIKHTKKQRPVPVFSRAGRAIEPDTRPSQVGPTLRGHLTAHSSKPSATAASAFPTPRNSTESSVDNNGSIIPPTQATKTGTKQSLTFLKDVPKSPKKSHHEMSATRLRTRLLAMQEQRAQRYRRAPPVICSSCGASCGRSTNIVTSTAESETLPTTKNEPSQTQDAATTATTVPVTRWHCIRNVGLDICSGCFDDGRFPSNFLSCDFVKLGLGAAPEEIVLRVLSKSATIAAGQHVSLETLMSEETDGKDDADLRDLYTFLKNETNDFNDGVGSNGGIKGGVGTLSSLLPWTHEETFLLLEGVEHFDEDWGKIAFHVGTRGNDECVERFLAVPIEEPYLTEAHATPAVLAFRRVADKLKSEDNARIGGSRDGGAGVSASVWPVSVFEKLPCTPVEDPVMALAALLASAVDENIARAVADAAIRAATVIHANPNERGRSGSVGNIYHAKKDPPILLASSTKSPKSNSVNVNLDVLAAELHLKKFGLILDRYEEKVSRMEHERCQADADRRINMSDAVVHRKEVREMRKKQKVDLQEAGGNYGNSDEKIQFGGIEVESELDEKSEQNEEEEADAQSLLDEGTQEESALEDVSREEEEDNVSDNDEQDGNSRDEADLLGSVALASCDIVQSITNLIGNEIATTNVTACNVVGTISQFVYNAVTFWTFSISLYCYISIIFKPKIADDSLKWLHVYSWTMSLLFTIMMFICEKILARGNILGDATYECWIGSNYSDLRVYLFYFPMWIHFFALGIMYTHMFIRVSSVQREAAKNCVYSNEIPEIVGIFSSSAEQSLESEDGANLHENYTLNKNKNKLNNVAEIGTVKNSR